MATPLDLEEQEQIDQIKHFWSQYGSIITGALILVLALISGYNAWQYWQNRQSMQASVMYQSVDQALTTADESLLTRALSDMQDKFSSATYTSHASLLAAKYFADHQQNDKALKALMWVEEHSSDVGLVSIARLRLASLSLDAHEYAKAQAWLKKDFPKAFEALAKDRLGDVLMAQAQTEEARAQYLSAWKAMNERTQYRQIIEVKLAALGVDVRAKETQP